MEGNLRVFYGTGFTNSFQSTEGRLRDGALYRIGKADPTFMAEASLYLEIQ